MISSQIWLPKIALMDQPKKRNWDQEWKSLHGCENSVPTLAWVFCRDDIWSNNLQLVWQATQ